MFGFGAKTASPGTAFGGTSTNQQTAGFGGFGSSLQSNAFKTSPTTPAFSFAAPTTQTTTAPTTAFGQTTSTAPTTTGFSFSQPATQGFGGATSGTGFGTTTGFGTAQSFGTTTGFGTATPGAFSTQPSTSSIGTFGLSNQTQPPAFNFSQGPTVGGLGGMWNTSTSGAGQSLGIFHEAIKDMKKKYAPYVDGLGNPNLQPMDNTYRPNQDCKFATVSYLRRDHPQTNPHLLDVLRGEDVDKNNPDPEKYFAVREYGVVQLQNRFDAQSEAIEKDEKNLKELQTIVESVDKRNSFMISRYEGLKLNFAHLQLKLLRLLRKIEILRNRGSPIQSSEIKYKEYLDRLIYAFQEPHHKLQQLLLLEVREFSS